MLEQRKLELVRLVVGAELKQRRLELGRVVAEEELVQRRLELEHKLVVGESQVDIQVPEQQRETAVVEANIRQRSMEHMQLAVEEAEQPEGYTKQPALLNTPPAE